MQPIPFAYLDPGAGSLLLQILLGGWAAALVLFKFGWRRLRAVFVREPSGDEQASS